jgi:hypothetical protein
MAGSPTWFDRLTGLLSGIQAFTPVPGTHDATLEECRVGALLNKELTKPDEHRDEELVHTLRVEYRRRQLDNAQVGRCTAVGCCCHWGAGSGGALAARLERAVWCWHSCQQKQRGMRTPLSCIDLHVTIRLHACKFLPCRPKLPALPAVPPCSSVLAPASAALPLGGCGSA